MKELHNHIFSNTTCISKEIMLRYINKQLSKNELYEVEKHMLDCELCSDAYEGMQFAENSSVLFAIDSQIDQRVAKGSSKSPIMGRLMVAASILVIVFGTYFTFNYFNTTINNESGLAINEVEELKKNASPITLKKKEVLNEQAEAKITAEQEDETTEFEQGLINQEYRAVVNIPDPLVEEQLVEVGDIISYDEEEVLEATEEKVTLSNGIAGERTNKAKGEAEKSLEALDDANRNEGDNRRQDNFAKTVNAESNNNAPGFFGNTEPELDKKDEVLKKEESKSKNKSKTRSVGNKKRFKTVAESQAPAYNYENGTVQQEMDFNDSKQQRTITMDSYKVVDYAEEYQQEYDLKVAGKIETKSVSAGFETKEDKDVADKEIDELVVEITYKETLENAMRKYKNKEYRKALMEFDVILAKHSKEVNAQFYSGLCYYNLKQFGQAIKKFDSVLKNKETEFDAEARWYKALTLIVMKDISTAKKVLKSIIEKNGFYKIKAEEKLKEI